MALRKGYHRHPAHGCAGENRPERAAASPCKGAFSGSAGGRGGSPSDLSQRGGAGSAKSLRSCPSEDCIGARGRHRGPGEETQIVGGGSLSLGAKYLGARPISARCSPLVEACRAAATFQCMHRRHYGSRELRRSAASKAGRDAPSMSVGMFAATRFFFRARVGKIPCSWGQGIRAHDPDFARPLGEVSAQPGLKRRK